MKTFTEAIVKGHILMKRNVTDKPGKFILSFDECIKLNGFYCGNNGDYFVVEDKKVYQYERWELHIDIGHLVERFEKKPYKVDELIKTLIIIIDNSGNTQLVMQDNEDLKYFTQKEDVKWAYITDKILVL